VAWLMLEGRAVLPVGSLGMDAFVAAAGLVTAAPLVLFNGAAKRLPLVTVGILQYIAPSIGFVLAVAAYGETFEAVHAWTFGGVWVALLLFTAESVVANRRAALTLSR
jgi:chloramphenicol-sensitive protein RarD